MPRAVLITNPFAARTDPAIALDAKRVLEGAGWTVELCPITGEGQAAVLARRATENGVDAVAVYGGDGTTMQAVRGMMGSGVPLALIPGGTGNLLAGNLRIPSDPAQAALNVAHGRVKEIDVGVLERDDGEHFFAVACGTGFDAEIMASTRGEHKRRWGMLAYVKQTVGLLTRLRSVPHRVTVDGKEMEVQACMVLAANCREFVPPLFKLRESISFDDGKLEMIAIRADSIWDAFKVVIQLAIGWHTKDNFVFAQGSDIRVETDDPRPVQFDGEVLGDTPMRARVLRRALKVLVPAT